MGIKIEVNLTNKWLYFLVGIFILVGFIGLSWAIGGTNPSIIGHSYGELGIPTNCANDQVLKYNSSSGSFVCGANSVNRFSLCYNSGSAVSGSLEACTNAKLNNGRGTTRYRAINCQASGYASVELASNMFYDSPAWKTQVYATIAPCTDGTILVVDLGA